MLASDLEQLFAATFYPGYRTRLLGGADEPLYLPAGEGRGCHQLFYREDYFSSALHETAHWCIAGEERRRLVDFGYWYTPDGRTLQQQRAFEAVEIKPQALEWLFATAAGVPFAVSADNLAGADAEARQPSPHFLAAVERQAVAWCRAGLPPRAASFVRALTAFYGTRNPLDPDLYLGRHTP